MLRLPLYLFLACTTPKESAEPTESVVTDSRTETGTETGTESRPDSADTAVPTDSWPFVDAVESYLPGTGAGFGQDQFPDVVYGPPEAPGHGGGSLDVLSLGQEGSIVVTFRALDLIDGPGADLLVFENPFVGWAETGVVGVSSDGQTWTEWPCDAENEAEGYPGCAGVALVYANSTNGVDATDPDAAGGDRFDLGDIGVAQARYVRVRDSGANSYDGVSGGFDLDAIAVVNGTPQ